MVRPQGLRIQGIRFVLLISLVGRYARRLRSDLVVKVLASIIIRLGWAVVDQVETNRHL